MTLTYLPERYTTPLWTRADLYIHYYVNAAVNTTSSLLDNLILGDTDDFVLNSRLATPIPPVVVDHPTPTVTITLAPMVPVPTATPKQEAYDPVELYTPFPDSSVVPAIPLRQIPSSLSEEESGQFHHEPLSSSNGLEPPILTSKDEEAPFGSSPSLRTTTEPSPPSRPDLKAAAPTPAPHDIPLSHLAPLRDLSYYLDPRAHTESVVGPDDKVVASDPPPTTHVLALLTSLVISLCHWFFPF